MGRIGSTYGGLFGKTKADFEVGNCRYVTFLNILENIVLDAEQFENVRVASGESQNCVREGDVLFNGTSETPGDLAMGAILDEQQESLYLNSFCFGFRIHDPNNCHPLFLAYFFRGITGRAIMYALAQGTTRYNMSKSQFLALELSIPSVEEQVAVAEVLFDVDRLLASLEKLIAKKRTIKLAAMQQLLTGKTRLPSFHGQWEVKRLGDVLTVHHGRAHSTKTHSWGRYPILGSGGEIGRTNRSIYDKPSVLIGRKGTIDNPQFTASPFWAIDTLFYTEIAHKICVKFIYYKLCTIDWKRYNEASGLPSLNSRTIESIEVSLPPVPEQGAIAAVLSDMDAEIAALELRRDKTRAIKQGMMQQLLTGRIRLVEPDAMAEPR